MRTLTFEELRGADIEQCRELCDELMAFQKSKAFMEPERFDAMNFDTRMKKSYESALEKHVVVAKDGGIPVGYVFSTVESAEGMRNSPFKLLPPEGAFPDRIGCLSNLYLKEGYRGGGLGTKLFDVSMEWLESFPDVDTIFIYISNGNDEAYDFYIKHGFSYSHDVLGGFIKAVVKTRNPRTTEATM